VSRFHSRITFHKGKFYLKDLESKFGTVTRLWHPISIPNKKDHSVEFQVGRSYIQLTTGGAIKITKSKMKYVFAF
jgi:hypothetical protein